jgi:hypothetical protein
VAGSSAVERSAPIEHWPHHQPRRSYTPATVARVPHTAQHVTHSALAAVGLHGVGPLTAAGGRLLAMGGYPGGRKLENVAGT